MLPDAAPDARTVSVRALCAFAAKAGDLDLRFVPAPSAQEGMAGHALVQDRRGEGYESEVALVSQCGPLRVRGRADGHVPRAPRVEEIKTFRGDFDAIRSNHRALHWAQARTYGWMLCEKHGYDGITVALVYLDLGSGEETVLEEPHTREALQAHFEDLCARYIAWADSEAAHHAALGAALAGLAFPHGAFRAGQRELAEAVYRAAAKGRRSTRSSFSPPRLRAAPWRSTRCACSGPVAARRGCSNSPRARRPANTPSAPATETPVRWPRASTTACPPRARRRPRPCASTGRRCDASGSRMACARISSHRRWRTGPT
jgi:hypothetical protein